MPNVLENYLTISAENKNALAEALAVVNSQIECLPAPFELTMSGSFDKDTKLHMYEMVFNTYWLPPFQAYIELSAIEGASIIASWLDEASHYQWLFIWAGEAHSYEAVDMDCCAYYRDRISTLH